MTKIERAGTAVLVGVLLSAAGCAKGGAGDGDKAGASQDTGAVGGLSPDELRARATAMSPEQAESLGIAQDTSIHMETPLGDTVPRPGPVGSPPPPDTGH